MGNRCAKVEEDLENGMGKKFKGIAVLQMWSAAKPVPHYRQLPKYGRLSNGAAKVMKNANIVVVRKGIV
jgi:hypothetical protein